MQLWGACKADERRMWLWDGGKADKQRMQLWDGGKADEQRMRLLAAQVNKATVNMLRRVEPYITWGTPNLKTVKELIYKRGYGKVRARMLAAAGAFSQPFYPAHAGLLCTLTASAFPCPRLRMHIWECCRAACKGWAPNCYAGVRR
jgi:hypothetical protein